MFTVPATLQKPRSVPKVKLSLLPPSTTSWWNLVVALRAVPVTLVQVLPSALTEPVRIWLKPAMSRTSRDCSDRLLMPVSVAMSMRSMLSMRLFSSRPMAPTLLMLGKNRFTPPLRRMVS